MWFIKNIIGWLLLSFTLQANAQFIELEDTPRTAAEVNSANSVRDNTTAPNSWIGGATERVLKSVAKDLAEAHPLRSRCLLIKNEAWKNNCIGSLEGLKGESWCLNIKNDDLKYHCLSVSRGDDFCGLIKNDDLKYHCLSVSRRDDFCGLIKSDDLKQHCSVLLEKRFGIGGYKN